MENMAVQRVLAIATRQLASRPALLEKMEQELASGQLWCSQDPDCMVLAMVSLEADGLIQRSFVESHLKHLIDEWIALQHHHETRPTSNQPADGRDETSAHEAPLSRAALIEKLVSRWPSIETDLRYYHMNGLGVARYGDYDWLESAALLWAGMHGKLTQQATDEALSTNSSPVT